MKGVTFKSGAELKEHVIEKHPGVRFYQCMRTYCGEIYFTRDEIREHILEHYGLDTFGASTFTKHQYLAQKWSNGVEAAILYFLIGAAKR